MAEAWIKHSSHGLRRRLGYLIGEEGCKVKRPRSSGGDLILAIDLQGVGVAPQLYNEGLTPSFERDFSHAIVMLQKYFLSSLLLHCALAILLKP